MAPSRLPFTFLLLAAAVCPAAAETAADPPFRDLSCPPAVSVARTCLAHPDVVTGAAWSADGACIYSACTDGVLRCWDAATGRLLQQRNANAGPLTGVAVSPDRHRIAAGSRGGRIVIWAVNTPGPLYDFEASDAAIASVAFAPGELRIVATDVRGGVRMHDILGDGPTSREIAPQGSGALSARFVRNRNCILTAGAPTRFHNLETPSESFDLKHTPIGEESYAAVDVSPSGEDAVCADDAGTVRLYSLIPGFPRGGVSLPRESRAVAVRWMSNNQTVALGADGTLWICDPPISYRVLLASSHPGGSILDASPDGTKILACLAANQLAVFERSTGLRRLPPEAKGRGVERLAVSADGTALLVARADGDIDLLDLPGGRRLRAWTLPDPPIHALVPCEDGRVLVSTWASSFVRVRDVTSGEELVRYVQPEAPAFARFSADGSLFACDATGSTVRIWNLPTGEEISKLPGSLLQVGERDDHFKIAAVAISPHSDLLAICKSYDSSIWVPGTGALQSRIADPHYPDVAAFSPDGFLLAVAGSPGVWVHSPAFPGGRQVADYQLYDSRRVLQPTDIVFSPDPKRAAVVYAGHGLLPFNPLRRVPTGLLVCPDIRCAVFLADGKTLAGGLLTGEIRLWSFGDDGIPQNADDPLDHLWGEMACQRLDRAHAAAENLAAAGDEGAKFLRDRLNERPKPQTVARLVNSLGSASAEERREAREELEWLGVLAEPDLRRSLNGDLSDTVRQNVEDLISTAESRTGPSRSNWQRARALLALEISGSAQALDVLQRVADESPSPRERADADAAVRRLRNRAAGGGK